MALALEQERQAGVEEFEDVLVRLGAGGRVGALVAGAEVGATLLGEGEGHVAGRFSGRLSTLLGATGSWVCVG